MKPADLADETIEDVYRAIVDAYDAGDVGLGGYPTTAHVSNHCDHSERVIRSATTRLDGQSRIDIGKTLRAPGEVGSATQSYVPADGWPAEVEQ